MHGFIRIVLADHVNVGLDQRGAKRLGLVIRVWHEDCGLTQTTLAARASISSNQLQNIETGKTSGLKEEADPSNPRMSTSIEICEVLSTSASEVLAPAGC
jgi:DNA-binding XRE family transcriptional regulator